MTAEVTEPTTPVEPRDELQHLDPQPLRLELKSGTPFDVQPLKLRQFLALLRIVTRGAAGVLSMGGLSAADGEDFARQLLAITLFAIPEAEDETIVFVQSMVKPADLTGDRVQDAKKAEALRLELENPELEDVVIILEAIINNEADDLKALGKRLQSMMKVAEKMGLTETKTD